jgi:molecular chaperone GrpE
MSEKKQKKEKKVDELTEVKTLLLRVQADFDNYRKRTQKEKEDYGKYLNTDLVLRLLPVLDNFKLAIAHQPKEIDSNAWAQGVLHIEKQLEQVMGDEGLVEIQALGKTFNHNLHEAIEEVDSKKPPGEITEVVMNGYTLSDRVIRHAKVKVSKFKEGEKNE